MLRTNLSTRPFYNARAVRLALGAAAVLVVGLTLFNAGEIVRLLASQRTLGERAATAEAEARRLQSTAAALRARINPEELRVVAAAAGEANGIIDRRAFSWTELLGRFEQALPDDARITAIQPRHENGRVIVTAIVEAREIEDLDGLIEALEKTGTFRDILPTQYQQDESVYRAVIEGVYLAAAPPAEAGAPARPAGEVPGE
jgi:hypothetical protein